MWGYVWLFVRGFEESFEVGLVGIAVIAFIQILTSLFCLWSVSVKVLLTTSEVSAFKCIQIHIFLLCDWNYFLPQGQTPK